MITTKDMNGNEVLKLFEDGVHIDEKLPKWVHAANYLKEKEKDKEVPERINTGARTYRVIAEVTPDATTNTSSVWNMPQTMTVYNTADPYEIKDDVKFDEIASASLLELAALIKSKELNNILSGYGGMHYGVNNSTPVITITETEQKLEKAKSPLTKAFLKLKLAYLKKVEKQYEFDVIEFFKQVKLTSKESKESYRDRVSKYLKAIHNANSVGQTALVEKLVKELIANKFESELYATGNYYVVTEEQVLDFIKKAKAVTTGPDRSKDICLTYVKNYTRPIPDEVIEKLQEANKLEVFDNYVIMHYDPKKENSKPTEKEIAKKKDPILFGVISGSRKLYYITDWIDEFCTLTLEKFVDTLGIKKEDLLADKPEKVEEPKEEKPKKAPSKKRSTTKKKKDEE